MATNINIIDVGLAPNDGNGDTLRESFIKVNENFTTIKTFIENPSFTNVEVTDTLHAETVDTEDVFVGHKLTVTAGTVSTSTTTGAVVIQGGLGVGDVIHGDIVSVNQSTTNLSANIANLESLGVASDASIAGNLLVGGNTEITGNLTVYGQTTTITTTNLAIRDPQIEVGKPDGGSLSYNDGIARGVLGYWYDDSTTSQQTGFFGISTTGELIFTPRNGQVGALGTARFDTVSANVSSSGTSTFNTLTANTINGSIATASQPNITSVGTLTGLDITGNVNLSGNAFVTGGMVYINGSPVITSATSFSGGTVPNPTIFTNTTNSTSPTTGAVRIQGGLGIEKDVYVAGTINSNNLVVTGDLTGTLSTNAQPNITSVGTLTNLSVANTVSASTVSTASVTASGAVSAATLSATLGITGTLQTASQPNITTVGTLTNLTVTNTINGTCQSVVTNANLSGDVTSIGNTTTIGVNKVTNAKMAQMAAQTVKGNANGVTTDPQDISMAQLAGMLPTFGTSKGLVPGVAYSVTQFLRADGSWAVPAYYTHPAYTTRSITTTGANVIATFTSDAIGSVTDVTTRTMTLADLGYTGATNANYITNTNQLVNGSGYITSSASITGSASTVTANAQPNITSVGTLTSLTTSGNVFIGEDITVSGNLTVNGTTTTLNVSTLEVEDLNITVAKNATTPLEAHGAGLTVAGANATLTYTQSTDRWTMNKSLTVPYVYGVAINAQYADLAEKYQSDAEYEPGTVLIFGGSREVTVTGTYADPAVAGVVSTNPAYVMNSEETHSVTVALRGKVPVKVIGPVRKGDLLVTSYIAGHAESVGKETKYGVSVFAKAIEEDLSTGKKVINAVII